MPFGKKSIFYCLVVMLVLDSRVTFWGGGRGSGDGYGLGNLLKDSMTTPSAVHNGDMFFGPTQYNSQKNFHRYDTRIYNHHNPVKLNAKIKNLKVNNGKNKNAGCKKRRRRRRRRGGVPMWMMGQLKF